MLRYKEASRLIGSVNDTIKELISAKNKMLEEYPKLKSEDIFVTVDTANDDDELQTPILFVSADVDPNEDDMKTVESEIRRQLGNIERSYPGLIGKILSEGL